MKTMIAMVSLMRALVTLAAIVDLRQLSSAMGSMTTVMVKWIKVVYVPMKMTLAYLAHADLVVSLTMNVGRVIHVRADSV